MAQGEPGSAGDAVEAQYADELPLARFEKVWAHRRLSVPRQALARWVIGSAQVLQSLNNLAQDGLLDHDLMHMDETPVQMLKEPGREASVKSCMWVRSGRPPGRPVVPFNYDPSRSSEMPEALLAGYRGWLMTVGYGGYDKAVKAGPLQQLGCWAHVGRKFMDAKRVEGKGKTGRADQALAMNGAFYQAEREAKDLAVQERQRQRHTLGRPVLHKLEDWLKTTRAAVPPSTVQGKALRNLQSQWPRLSLYVKRGDLPIDNSRAENAIRPFVLCRKAWMFSDTQAGAHVSALIDTLIKTARANGVEPYAWLAHVMRSIATANSVDDYEALMPRNFHPA